MPRFVLTGDICYPGFVAVTADTLEQAVQLAQQGEFEISDETACDIVTCDQFEFRWSGEYEEEEE